MIYGFRLSENSKECSLSEFFNIIKNNLFIDNSNINSFVKSKYEYYFILPNSGLCYYRSITCHYFKFKMVGTKKIIYDTHNNEKYFTYNKNMTKRELLKELNILLRKEKIKTLCQNTN